MMVLIAIILISIRPIEEVQPPLAEGYDTLLSAWAMAWTLGDQELAAASLAFLSDLREMELRLGLNEHPLVERLAKRLGQDNPFEVPANTLWAAFILELFDPLSILKGGITNERY